MTLDIKFYITEVKDADDILSKIREVLKDRDFEWNFGGNSFDYQEMETKSKLPEIVYEDPKKIVEKIAEDINKTEGKKHD